MKKRDVGKGFLCAALAAAMFLIPGLSQMKSFAFEQVATDRLCTLTVRLGEDQFFEDLGGASFPVKMYKVAEMDESGKFTALEGFEELELDKVGNQTKAEDWENMALKAASVLGVIPAEEGGETQDEEVQDEKVQDEEIRESEPDAQITMNNGVGVGNDLPVGLYLLYTPRVDTDMYTYTFQPSLISLPTNDYTIETGGTDAWYYDVSVGLKPEQGPRTGKLRIEKTLNNYHALLGDATFVFQIDARRDGELVYSNVVSLNFSGAGSKSVVVDQIPADTDVTVREVYSGASYQIAAGSSSEYQISFRADENNEISQSVAFTNDYNGGRTSGSSVVNHFAYDGTGWVWEKVTDSQASAGEE